MREAVITNTGKLAGAEVVQLYIAPPQQGVHRPLRELKGFARVELQPGESKNITFTLDDRSFCVWNKGWKKPTGIYEIQIATFSRDVRLQEQVQIVGEDIAAEDWQNNSWYETMDGEPYSEELRWEERLFQSDI